MEYPNLGLSPRLSAKLQAFRGHAQAAHLTLEKSRVAQALLADNLSRHQYIDVLISWQRVWVAIEQRLGEQRTAEIDSAYAPVPRAHLLARDLQALGAASPLSSTLPSLPVTPEQAPEITWFACAYICQGSLLGSKTIARHLAQLGYCEGRGTDFFSHSKMHQPWPQWLQWFSSQLEERACWRTTSESVSHHMLWMANSFNHCERSHEALA